MRKAGKNALSAVLLSVVAAVLYLTAIGAAAQAVSEHTVYHANGSTIAVPTDGWSVQAVPRGYNTAPYDAESNPGGKLPGWRGWPGYDRLCPAGNPDPYCHRPYFITGPQEEPPPDCSPPDQLAVGPTPPCLE